MNHVRDLQQTTGTVRRTTNKTLNKKYNVHEFYNFEQFLVCPLQNSSILCNYKFPWCDISHWNLTQA